eukprot:GHVP01023859.1.p1 GENE.GHVP01023859.1~~GHVP01023859.1.p1  ORF type:complete len:421 (-),score=66.88 GHVP01023859.1:278-1540(-)
MCRENENSYFDVGGSTEEMMSSPEKDSERETARRKNEIAQLTADWTIPSKPKGRGPSPDPNIRSRWGAFCPNQLPLELSYDYSLPKRNIPKISWANIPTPEILDDFYLNLLDWSSKDLLAQAAPKEVLSCRPSVRPKDKIKLEKFVEVDEREDICSISFDASGDSLAVGTKTGCVHIYDCQTRLKIRTYNNSTSNRVAVLNWNLNGLLACGTRDKNVIIRDTRAKADNVFVFSGHTQEVCGLKWSEHDPNILASGGNDNSCYIWRMGNSSFEKVFVEHNAAVKAISWSPHQNGLLATGGGTNDRCIKVFDVKESSSNSLATIDTESQVCNIVWSKNCDELISSHGYTLHQLVAWQWLAKDHRLVKVIKKYEDTLLPSNVYDTLLCDTVQYIICIKLTQTTVLNSNDLSICCILRYNLGIK